MVATKAESEMLVALCLRCTCCLAGGPHCWTCHTTTSIDRLCGCGDCSGQAQVYAETQALRIRNQQIKYGSRPRG